MKSIKEVAEITGLSRQAVFNNCKSLSIEPFKIKNKSHITDEDYARLIERIVNNHQTTETTLNFVLDEAIEDSKDKTKFNDVLKQDEDVQQDDSKHFVKLISVGNSSNNKGIDDNIDEVIKDLKGELSRKNSEIDKFKEVEEILKNQIDDLKNDKAVMIEEKKELRRLLDQQQRLAIDSNNKIKRLEAELNKSKSDLMDYDNFMGGNVIQTPFKSQKWNKFNLLSKLFRR